MNKEIKYEEAFAQLQEIVRKLENDECGIDEIAVHLTATYQIL